MEDQKLEKEDTDMPIIEASSVSAKNKSDVSKIVIISIIMLILGIGIGFLLSKLVVIPNPTSNGANTITPTSANSLTKTPVLTQPVIQNAIDFNGKYVTAKLPPNWKITESSVFLEETVSGSPDSYSGLARLTISYKDKSFLVLRAAYGVGDTGECNEIFKFSDTDPDFIQARIETNMLFGMEADPIITDFSNSDYSEFIVLGNTVRRVETELYFKDDYSVKYFNPSCGFSNWMREFVGLKFSTTILGKVESSSGFFVDQSAPSALTDTEKQQYDQVLISLKPVK